VCMLRANYPRVDQVERKQVCPDLHQEESMPLLKVAESIVGFGFDTNPCFYNSS